jgi:NADH-quinone oxidoreductase subunit H
MDWNALIPLLVTLITIAVILGGVLGGVAYLTLLERKVSAWVQDRYGPNRVGFDFGQSWLWFLRKAWGLGQPLADGVKFLLKEDVIPGHVDKVFYLLAPMIAMGTALFAMGVVSIGDTPAPPALVMSKPIAGQEKSGINVLTFPTSIEDVKRLERSGELKGYVDQNEAYQKRWKFSINPGADIGFLFIFAVGSLAVYGIVLGGWSSNNKYSLLGSLRSSAQMISYEIPMGLSIVGVLILVGSLNLERIVDWQARNGWLAFYQPTALLLFLTAIFAECNRLPFDLPECEQELVGGSHTEYSAMKFAMFFLGEYTHMITTSFLTVALFLGGWHLPGLEAFLGADSYIALAAKLGLFMAKVGGVVMLVMMIRWTILRFKFNQLMNLAWKGMMPLGVLSLLGSMVVGQFGLSPWLLLPWSLAILLLVTGLGAFLPAEDTKVHFKVTRGRAPSASGVVVRRPAGAEAV